MKPMQLEEIRRVVHGRWLARGRDIAVSGVTTDSRAAGPGQLFVALRGEKYDGHNYLTKAANAGCVAALVRRDGEPPPEVSQLFGAGVIGVDDTVEALAGLAQAYREMIPSVVIAVTGSNGKTTVKRMIHHILSRMPGGHGELMKGMCSPKSYNNAIGVPLTLLGVEAGDDYVICEVGSNAPGEIANLSRMVRPDVAVITNVSQSHLEGLGSVEQVAVEKASMLGCLGENGLAVIGADYPSLDNAMSAYQCKVIRYGLSAGAELRLTDYRQEGDGQCFQMNDSLWVRLPVSGRHNALNAMAAIAVAQRLGYRRKDAAKVLEDFSPPPMRLERVETGDIVIINDAYNANPASVKAAVEVLGCSDAHRRVAVLGDMLELGPDAKQLHLVAGRKLAGMNVDFVIGVGRLGRYIARGAAEAGIDVEIFSSVGAAARNAEDLLQKGDVVLIKGSRGMRMERIVNALTKSRGQAPRSASKKKTAARKKSKRKSG